MIEVTLDDYKVYLSQLQKQMDFTKQDIINMNTLFTNLKSTNEAFSNDLKKIVENFHKDIMNENNTELMLSYYQLLGNNILNISQIHLSFVTKIQSEILDDVIEFSTHIIHENNHNMTKIYKIIEDLEEAITIMGRLQDNYYKLSRNAEKAQEKFVKFINEGGKNPEQSQKEQEKSQRIKLEAQDACTKFKAQIAIVNQLWEIFYEQFIDIFKKFDENEENRLGFTRNSIAQILKHLNGLYNQSHSIDPSKQMMMNFEIKLCEYDKNFYAKQNSFKCITKGKLDDHLAIKKVVEFASYETTKKSMDSSIISVESQGYDLILKPLKEKDIQFLSNYIKDLATQNFETLSVDSIIGDQVMEKYQYVQDRDDQKLQNLMTNKNYRKFFLDHLVKLRDLAYDSTEIRFKKSRIPRFIQLIKKILEDTYDEKDWESIFSILVISTKFYAKNGDSKDYLYNHLKDLPILQNLTFWLGITTYLIDKKISEKMDLKNIKNEEMPANNTKIFSRLISFGKKHISGFLDQQQQQQQQQPLNHILQQMSPADENEIYLSVLQQVNYYIGKVAINPEIAAEFIINLAKKYTIERKEIEELIQFQQIEHQNCLKITLNLYSSRKEKIAREKWDSYYPIYKALSYLELKDLLNIFLINKEFNKKFRNKIYRLIITKYGHKLNENQRNTLWIQILSISNKANQIDFQKNLEEFMKLITIDKSIKHVDEVITIDVLRSFINHKNLNSDLLHNLLRAYSNYDKQISYCQGMNYIMGFILIKFKDENITLNCFCALMKKFLKDMYDNEFHKLKMYFYQFNKLIELHLPELYNHFVGEKVESTFFIPAWFITVFTNTFQNTLRSHFLNRIWDHFILDGIKTLFQISLVILKLYEKDLLKMKFDGILHFLGDIGKHEIFTNSKYYMIKVGDMLLTEDEKKNYDIIKNIDKLIEEIILPKCIMEQLDTEYMLYEYTIPKILDSLDEVKELEQEQQIKDNN